MARILALDVGDKTIGTAVSDESETYAFPRHTLLRGGGRRQEMAALKRVVDVEQADELVVGLPLNMDGTRGPRAEIAERFAALLRRTFSEPVHLEDERLSTFEAESRLAAAGRRPDPRTREIDSLAAAVILESFLQRRRRNRAT